MNMCSYTTAFQDRFGLGLPGLSGSATHQQKQHILFDYCEMMSSLLALSPLTTPTTHKYPLAPASLS